MTALHPRRPRCDSVLATGFVHALGAEVWWLRTPVGRLHRFCSWSCVITFLTNMQYEDVMGSALGMAQSASATGTAG